MKYTEPVYDRVLSDVTNKTAKGYFNLADWIRIYGNAELIHALEEVILSNGLTFTEIATPTITTIPTVDDINTLLVNIETVRALFPTGAGLVELKTDWGGNASPTYKDVNDWERNIDLLLALIIEGYSGWIPDSGSPVRRHRAGVAVSGVGLTRNNGFRRYA